jgi:hypothetical protein
MPSIIKEIYNWIASKKLSTALAAIVLLFWLILSLIVYKQYFVFVLLAIGVAAILGIVIFVIGLWFTTDVFK